MRWESWNSDDICGNKIFPQMPRSILSMPRTTAASRNRSYCIYNRSRHLWSRRPSIPKTFDPKCRLLSTTEFLYISPILSLLNRPRPFMLFHPSRDRRNCRNSSARLILHTRIRMYTLHARTHANLQKCIYLYYNVNLTIQNVYAQEIVKRFVIFNQKVVSYIIIPIFPWRH